MSRSMNPISNRFKKLALLSPLSLALVACQGGMGGSGSKDLSVSAPQAAAAQVSKYDVNRYPINKLVCNPTGGSDPASQGGLKASLFWEDASQPRYGNVSDFFKNSHQSEHTFFFTQLNTPTRLFTLGFPTQTGAMIQDDLGNNLIEYFGLQYETVLQLAPDQAEGTYQFAFLADDGATLEIRGSDGTYQMLINDDSIHPTKMGCSSKTLDFKRDTQYVARVRYYNGPRYHIAMVAMMRKTDSSNPKDALCDQNGNSLFFDPDHGSKPQKAYNDLIARGWMVMEAGNFSLPQEEQINPCVGAKPAIISDFKIVKSDYYSLEVSWTTNVPTTSQVNYTNLKTNANALTISDNTLSTTHDIVISNLDLNTPYSLQAVAITADYGKTISTPITGRTLNVE